MSDPHSDLEPIEVLAEEFAQRYRRGERPSLSEYTDRYPELESLADALPDGTVLDGEILPWKANAVLPFGELQKRIGRKTISKKLLEEVPAVLMAYDLIEEAGADLRERPLAERRQRLEALAGRVNHTALILSPRLAFGSWDALAGERRASRARGVEGMMLKRRTAPYRVGRVRGDWWKWKVEPFAVDAVLIYAQPGHGKRSGLYTDYTFGVWREQELVPVAKAYSGLSNPEVEQLDRWIRAHTLEKFGPVRAVEPSQVFQLAYEGIAASGRHKSGIALRFPRILRWRTDKPASEADTLANLQAMLIPAPDEVRRSG